MRIYPGVQSDIYDLWSDPIEEKKLLIDGGKGVIKHRTLYVYLKHRKSGDVIRLRLTGKGKYYCKRPYQVHPVTKLPVEEGIPESEVRELFQRLIGKDGDLAFRMSQIRLYME